MEYMTGLISIPALVEDAKRALKANAQFSALCITFALVDECASVEWYKNHSQKAQNNNEKSFVQWYDMWFSSVGCDEFIKQYC